MSQVNFDTITHGETAHSGPKLNDTLHSDIQDLYYYGDDLVPFPLPPTHTYKHTHSHTLPFICFLLSTPHFYLYFLSFHFISSFAPSTTHPQQASTNTHAHTLAPSLNASSRLHSFASSPATSTLSASLISFTSMRQRQAIKALLNGT